MTAPERIWAKGTAIDYECTRWHTSKWNGGIEYIRADLAALTPTPVGASQTPDPAIKPAAMTPEVRALWDLLEEIEAQIDLAEEISPKFADKVQVALWGGAHDRT